MKYPRPLSRYGRVSRGEGASAVRHDRSADQSEGTAAVGSGRAEKDGRLTAGETKAAGGAGPAAAGAGVCVCLQV